MIHSDVIGCIQLGYYPRRYASDGTNYDPVSLSLSVCLSVTSGCSIEMDGRIQLVFGMSASFDLSYSVL